MILAERAASLIRGFTDRRVLVVGDVILDRYVWGRVERISPEAPVPVVQVKQESVMPGGAANVARNVAALGGSVELVAVVGDDETGQELARLLADAKIDPDGLMSDPGRPTTVKTRVIARAQQVVRFDRESEEPLATSSLDRLIDAVRERAARVDGVILQDYAKGVLFPEVLHALMPVCAAENLPVFVDPKSENWECYRDAELVKPNLREAAEVTGIRIRSDEDLAHVGRRVLEYTGARTVAITRGDRGISLFYRDGGADHVPTEPRAVADATGAGDTVIATVALARLAGASWVEAAALANAAAAVVVEVPGTACVSPEELMRAVTRAGGRS
jgi:D-beta-D-heptose 7-phosphate kinase/D-beta-D-heptose 1-phosphate adenosyltransferase